MSIDRERFARVLLGTTLGFALGVTTARAVVTWRDNHPAERVAEVAPVAPIGVLYTPSGNGPFQVAEVLSANVGLIKVRTTDGGEVATNNGVLVLWKGAVR